MQRAISLAAFLCVMPAAAFAIGSGMGMYGTASFGGGGGGNSTSENAKEDYDAAVRLMDKEDYADAIPHLVRALRVEQGNAGVLNDLGYATRMSGDYSTSVDYLQRAISRNPDFKMAYVNLGEVYLAMHQPDQARQQLGELTKLCPDGCEEKDGLTQSIAAYDASAKSTTPPGGP